MFNDVIIEQTVFTGKVLRALVEGPRSVTEIAAALAPTVEANGYFDAIIPFRKLFED